VSGPRPLPELAGQAPDWQPHFAPPSDTVKARSAEMTFRRTVWQLQFAFKPVRLIEVELPAGDGTMAPRQVWYLLYRVQNTGTVLKPTAYQDEFGHTMFKTETSTETVRFLPVFALQSHDTRKTYLDRVIPAAVTKIHARELRDPRIKLYDSVSITTVPVAAVGDDVTGGIWGVATWDGVDRRTDFFSVFVQGLSNAYLWEEGGSGGDRRQLFYKTLQLNFWRPGDAVYENLTEFRYGLPLITGDLEKERVLRMYGSTSWKDYRWLYLP
jgi:hypothetical protein